jgi:hypothetical protein
MSDYCYYDRFIQIIGDNGAEPFIFTGKTWRNIDPQADYLAGLGLTIRTRQI